MSVTLNPPPHAERFHALDATRAFALLLGIVFHIAWCFVPRASGTPISDVSSSVGFDWFFYSSHIFRMQVFFLIAGFFARMMYHRRGASGFAKNRLSRIAVPFAIGWSILVPLILLTWTWGGNRSGQNLVDVPLSLLTLLMAKGLIFVPRSTGGLFSLGHLWFLYYLLWLYLLAVVFRFLLTRTIAKEYGLKQRGDQLVRWCLDSPWSLLVLALATALMMAPMHGWNGVDTPVRQYAPSLPVLAIYGSFFTFGWLLHRHTGLLPKFIPHWKWQLGLGLALSVVLFVTFSKVRQAGMGSGLFGSYPALSPNHIQDWPAFLSELQSAANEDKSNPRLAGLWDHFDPGVQAEILSLPGTPSVDRRVGVCNAINKLLITPGLFEPVVQDANDVPLPSTTAPSDERTAQSLALHNRQTFEQVFAGHVSTDYSKEPWYWPFKYGYSVVYCLAMWSLAFATLGYFQQRCSHHSPVWRYIADSSYWAYLIHIPLVIWMHVWIANWHWHGLLKFLLLNVGAFVLLFASYHYLVRSTYIGKVLNGRRYPFSVFPWTPRPIEELPQEAPAAPLDEPGTAAS